MSRIGLLGTEILGSSLSGETWGATQHGPFERGGALDAGRPFLECSALVREGLLRLLGAAERSIEVRLSTLMEVADRVSGYFHENAAAVDREQLVSDLYACPGSSPRTPTTWTDVMALRVARFYLEQFRAAADTGLGRLVERVRGRYGRTAPMARPERLTEAEVLAVCGARVTSGRPFGARCESWDDEVVLRTHRSRRALLLLTHGQRIERFYADYCLHHILVNDYTDWPDLRSYARDLALRVASLRFLLCSHPSLTTSAECSAEGPESRELEGELGPVQNLDAVLSETSQCVNRGLEEGDLFLELRRATRIDEVPGPVGLSGLVSL